MSIIGWDTETQNGKVILSATPSAYCLGRTFCAHAAFLFENLGPFGCWNLRYDAQALFARLPRDCQWRLARLGRCLYRDFQIRWIDGKELVIKRGEETVRLYDVAQYYHQSLDNAAVQHLGERKTGENLDKTNMARELKARPEEVIRYCCRDASLTERLWARIEKGFEGLAVECSRPISPAFLAGKSLLREHVKPRGPRNHLFKPCYFGGRNEVLQRGLVENVFRYDIHSAYPEAMANLPDCTRAALRIGQQVTKTCLVGTYHVEFDGTALPFGPVPVRAGVLCYPAGPMRAWVDRSTLEVLFRYARNLRILESVELVHQGHKPWNARICELYRLRENPELKLAAKLLLNGAYGKTVQQIETWELADDLLEADLYENGHFLKSRMVEGWHYDLAVASHITGATRAKLFRAMMIDPESVLMVATDAVFSRGPLPLDVGPALGQWELTTFEAGLFIETGIYALKPFGGSWKSYIRGFASRLDLVESLKRAGKKTSVAIECQLPLTMLWALKRGETINRIGTWERVLDLNADTKRQWTTETNAANLLAGLEASQPRKGKS